MLPTLFHVFVLVYFLYVSYWVGQNMLSAKDTEEPTARFMKRNSLRYLTNWTFTMQVIFYASSLIGDILGLSKSQIKLRDRIRWFEDYLFTVLAAPMAIMVSIVFWGLWNLFDRELIFPKVIDKVLPLWVNHSLHTSTSVFVIIEMFIVYHRHPAFAKALAGITVFLALYNVCLVGTYFETGHWIYPVFKLLDWNWRILFFLGSYLLVIIIYSAMRLVNSLFWAEKPQHTNKKIQKKAH